MKRTCADCKHWSRHEYPTGSVLGSCAAAWESARHPEPPHAPHAEQAGCNCCMDGVNTTEDFGCILYEGK